MAKQALTVKDGMVVTLDYVLRLEDGEISDSSEESGPVVFLQGAGEVLPAIEQAIYDMSVGQEKDLVVSPEDGYGEFDDDAFELLPLDDFPEEMELFPGMEIELEDDESDEVLEAIVAEIRSDGVLVDFNHSLAGETLHYHLKISDLRPATPEELEHDHAHDDNHHHH